MASAAEGGSNGVSIEPGDLSAEDAERFASEFKPSWELDEAPFTAATNGKIDDLHALAGGGVNADVAAALKSDTIHTSGLGVVTSTVVMDRSTADDAMRAAQAKAQTQAQVQQRPAAPAMLERPQMVASARPESRPAQSFPQRSRTEDTGALLVPIKKSNKGILFAGIGVVAGLALIFGIRAATSSSDAEPANTTTQAVPTSPKEEPRIPPPPPASEIPVATATPHAAEPVAAAAPAVQPPPSPVPHDPPRAAEPRPTPRAPAPPPQARVPDRRPPPAAPKPPAKGPPGGIVRDNPF